MSQPATSQPAISALEVVEDFTEGLSTTFDTCYTLDESGR